MPGYEVKQKQLPEADMLLTRWHVVVAVRRLTLVTAMYCVEKQASQPCRAVDLD